MTLLLGTDEGVARVGALPLDGAPETVLDCGVVHRVRRFDGADGVFVAADEGLFRSTDAGDTWEDLDLPSGDSDVWSVLATDDGTLFAGTNDPSLFRSLDGGERWTRLLGFEDLPSRGRWESPIDPTRSRVRALESPPGHPDRVVVGIESGGFHVSDDAGETWTDRRDRAPDDFHEVLALGRDVYVAANGYLDLDLEALDLGHALGRGGVNLTKDAGRSWRRLDVGNEYAYTRSVCLHDGSLLFGAATMPPPDWMQDGADAAFFESSGMGRGYRKVDWPGPPHEVVEACLEVDGRVVLGAAAFPDGEADGPRGRLVRRSDDGTYETVGTLDPPVRCFTPV